MPLMTEGLFPQKWGSLCDQCPHRARKETVGCDDHGCDQMIEDVDIGRNNALRYSMHCWHCRTRTPVRPADGWYCASCGLDCSYASRVLRHQVETEAGKIVQGPLIDAEAAHFPDPRIAASKRMRDLMHRDGDEEA